MPKANVNGVSIYYELAGRGYPVVLLHGFASNNLDWAQQMPVLASQYRVLVMDHRGHGLSAAPVAEKDYSMRIFAGDVKALLDALDIKRCCVVGQSMGGFIALELAVQFPQVVSALFLAGTSASIMDEPGFTRHTELITELVGIARSKGMGAVFDYDIENNPLTRQYLEKYPGLLETARSRMIGTSVDGYEYTLKAIQNWEGVEKQLATINIPARVIAGEEDSFFLEKSKHIAAKLPHASFLALRGTGHSPSEEAPQIVNSELLKFLSCLG